MHPSRQSYLSPQLVLFENLSAPAEWLGVVEEIMLYGLGCEKSSNIYSGNIHQLTISHISLNKYPWHLVELTQWTRIKLLQSCNTKAF